MNVYNERNEMNNGFAPSPEEEEENMWVEDEGGFVVLIPPPPNAEFLDDTFPYLEGRRGGEKGLPLQMVHFVLDNTSGEATGKKRDLFALVVHCAYQDTPGSTHSNRLLRKCQAALVLLGKSRCLQEGDHGIEKGVNLLVVSKAEDTVGNPYLGCRDTHTLVFEHEFDHSPAQSLSCLRVHGASERVVHVGKNDFLGDRVQRRMIWTDKVNG